MTHPPYHIRHYSLPDGLQLPKLDTTAAGHYLVYWWKDIPLGHVRIAPGETLSSEQYTQKLAESLSPALEAYAPDAAALPPWQAWLSSGNTPPLLHGMAQVLDPLLPHTLPATVPVSVVICTRNRPALLQNCLELLRNQRCQPQEILVVDNASSDKATEAVVNQYPEVRYTYEARGGLDIARNTGIRLASCPLVAFLDDDVVAHPLWVYRVWQSFEDPQVAALTGLVLAAELQTEAQQIFEWHWSFNRGYRNKLYDQQYFKQTLAIGPPVWEIGAGANMAFRKSVFEQVGYFNELLDVGAAGCNGDSEMWFRILAGGFSIRYNPLAVVHHTHRRELSGLKKQIYYYMRGFATAALLQQQQQRQAGYRKHLLLVLPKFYVKLIRQG
ncbi:glycosyltransferase family 2 protein, partial [Cesiribacter andamanensis]|uniref:glycosyltransferase family 2 protein n=1 Tax=Cesiribacter andamanensis TaxID=649507 RepID=UPI000590C075